MKKFLTTLIVAASAAIHAQAADLENQLPGYWQPDMAKTVAIPTQVYSKWVLRLWYHPGNDKRSKALKANKKR